MTQQAQLTWSDVFLEIAGLLRFVHLADSLLSFTWVILVLKCSARGSLLTKHWAVVGKQWHHVKPHCIIIIQEDLWRLHYPLYHTIWQSLLSIPWHDVDEGLWRFSYNIEFARVVFAYHWKKLNFLWGFPKGIEPETQRPNDNSASSKASLPFLSEDSRSSSTPSKATM